MVEYIKREKLIKSLELSINSWGRDCNSNAPVMVRAYKDVLHRVENIPAADVVEVVRCKNCHYGRELDKDEENYQEGYYECRLCENGDCNPCDHYCSYGVKKVLKNDN